MIDKHPPLKRHSSLQPFSRDHFHALVCARDLTEAADARARAVALQKFITAWEAEIAAHFTEEEQLLIPLMEPEEIDRLTQEHQTIRQWAAQVRRELTLSPSSSKSGQEPKPSASPVDLGAKFCRRLGEALHNHVRWEERTLFELLQARATPAQLEQLAQATHAIEATRPGLRIRGRGPRSTRPPPDTGA